MFDSDSISDKKLAYLVFRSNSVSDFVLYSDGFSDK